MQITLIQVEIEEAIRQYVNHQINVREGMRIDIDLKATRGAEGYQAFVDIVPVGSATAERVSEDVVEKDRFPDNLPVAAEDPKQDTAEVTVRRTRGPNKPKADPTIGSTASQPFGSDDTQDDAEYMGRGAEPSDEVADEEVVNTGSSFDTPPTEAPKEKPRSLFGNLQRPTNA